MHSLGEGGKVRIVSANDDPGMIGVLAVKADKVLPVVRKDRTADFGGEAQHFIVGDASVRLACVVRGENIMPKPSQFLDCGQRKILVGIQPGPHESSPLAAISRSISSRCERA